MKISINQFALLCIFSIIIFSCKKNSSNVSNSTTTSTPSGRIISISCYYQNGQDHANISYEITNVTNIAHVYLCLYNWGYPKELPISSGVQSTSYDGINYPANQYYLQFILNDGTVINTPYQLLYC